MHACMQFSVIIQGNSICVLFNGLLAELITILDSSSPIPQMIT